MSGNSVRLPSTKPSILCPQIDQPVFRSLPDGPAMDAAVEAYTSSAAQLIVRAQALEQVYQRMWQQEDVDARIYLYLRALDLICKFTGANEPLVTPVSPVSEGFVASELPVCEKDDHRNLTIGAWFSILDRQHWADASSSNRNTSVRHQIRAAARHCTAPFTLTHSAIPFKSYCLIGLGFWAAGASNLRVIGFRGQSIWVIFFCTG